MSIWPTMIRPTFMEMNEQGKSHKQAKSCGKSGRQRGSVKSVASKKKPKKNAGKGKKN